MRCLCPHYRETAGGWCCSLRLQYEEQIAALKDALAREKAKVRRLQAKLGSAPATEFEAKFGDGAPSSQRLKETSSEEDAAKKGGAKPGHKCHPRRGATQEDADETLAMTVDGTCPCCGGELEDWGRRERTVLDCEEPRRRRLLYRLGRMRCRCCGAHVDARPPGVLPRMGASNRLLATLSQMAYAEMVSVGAVSRMLGLNKGTVLGMASKLAGLLAPCLAAIAEAVRSSKVVHGDESPWRSDGRNGYVWVFVGKTAVLVLFRKTRSGDVAIEAVGQLREGGVLVTDRYTGYDRLVGILRQFCYEHLKRDLLKIGKENPKSAECAKFVSLVLPLLKEAMALRRRERERDRYLKRAREIRDSIMGLMRRKWRHGAIRAYTWIFENKYGNLFLWVEDPDVPAENNAAERAVRPLAVARKVSHGSQGDGGLRTREILTSVWLTLRMRHGQDAWKVLVAALDKRAADPKTDLVRELFPEYEPKKEPEKAKSPA